jgi:hypothetical protein
MKQPYFSRDFRKASLLLISRVLGLVCPTWFTTNSRHNLSDGTSKRCPGFNDKLQITVKRSQKVTREAFSMQRICSAALLAVVAIANN